MHTHTHTYVSVCVCVFDGISACCIIATPQDGLMDSETMKQPVCLSVCLPLCLTTWVFSRPSVVSLRLKRLWPPHWGLTQRWHILSLHTMEMFKSAFMSHQLRMWTSKPSYRNQHFAERKWYRSHQEPSASKYEDESFNRKRFSLPNEE